MSTTETIKSSVIFGFPIIFVDDLDTAYAAIDHVEGKFREFFLIGDSDHAKRPTKLKDRPVTHFRIRSSGSWNSLFRKIGEIDSLRTEEGQYVDAFDLLIVSVHSAHDISSALKRHRAVNKITNREMHFLDTMDLPDNAAAVETLHLAMDAMPSMPVPILYSNLSIEQRFSLTSFEFSRFTRPIHCARSVADTINELPFWCNLDESYGPTYRSTHAEAMINVGTVGHKDDLKKAS